MKKPVYEFISKTMQDPIIEWKVCPVSGEEFAIFQSDVDYFKTISPRFAGRIFSLPTPTLSPNERLRRRLAYNQETMLYNRTCDLTGKKIISGYSPDKPFKVYDHTLYRTDQWNPLDYGQDADLTKPFFQQFRALMLRVPRISLLTDTINQNSPYVNQANGVKNCYLVWRAVNDEDCFYSYRIINSNKTFDCSYVNGCELCYECLDMEKCYKCIYSKQCVQCQESGFLYDCQNCRHCFMCWNLRGKQYCIFNKQYTKEQYEHIMTQWNTGDHSVIQSLQSKRQDVLQHAIHRACYTVNTHNSFGHNLINAKDSVSCFNAGELEDCKYCTMFFGGKKCYDATYWGVNVEYVYDSVTVGEKSYNVKFCSDCWNIQECLYCDTCINCKHCFGCIGLNQQEYCIFNKKYTKEEYDKMVAMLLDHMVITQERGEFFPISISPLCYNESPAQLYFPLRKEEIEKYEAIWMDKEYPPTIPDTVERIAAENLPAAIANVHDDIIDTVIICEKTGKPFRILKKELDFYRQINVPLSRIHPNERNTMRIASKEVWDLSLRKCDATGEEIVSVYPVDVSFPVYGEKAYDDLIY